MQKEIEQENEENSFAEETATAPKSKQKFPILIRKRQINIESND